MPLTCRLDASDSRPLYEQLYQHTVRRILDGSLPSGSALPSRRALCQHLKISAATVETAYQLLLAEGYILSRPRSGYVVSALQPLPEASAPRPAPSQEPARLAPRFDFSTSASDAGLFPYKVWAKLFKETLYGEPELLQRGHAQGDLALRQTLSDFLSTYRGLNAPPERIIIGAGSDYLLSVLLQLLPKGSVMAAEDPGYHGIYRACARQGLPCLPIPCDSQGMSAQALKQSSATIAHVTPSHQFPLGISMPVGRRTQLLHWAGQAEQRYLIEDDYDSEFHHSARPLPAMQGLDGAQRVIYLGTFSRSLAPSMRLAYMILPEALLQVHHQQHLKSGETVSRFEQQTLARFIAEGYYLRHLRRAGRAYAQRLQRLCASLSALKDVQFMGRQAGLHFLLRLPHLSERQMISLAARQGIELRGLSEYAHAQPVPSGTVILGFAGLSDEQVAPAAQALVTAWGIAKPAKGCHNQAINSIEMKQEV